LQTKCQCPDRLAKADIIGQKRTIADRNLRRNKIW
jgi:hypothetical protein